jgi:hypothetical protein
MILPPGAGPYNGATMNPFRPRPFDRAGLEPIRAPSPPPLRCRKAPGPSGSVPCRAVPSRMRCGRAWTPERVDLPV